MPRIPSEDEEDAIAAQEDDRAETAAEVQAGAPAAEPAEKPGGRVVQYDDRAARTAPGTVPHSITYEPRPVRTVDDLDPAVREHLKAAKEATRKRLAQLDEDDAIAETPVKPAPPAAATAQAPAPTAVPAPAAAAPAAPPASPASPASPAAQPAPAPEVPTLDPRIVAQFEKLNSAQTAFEAQRKEWETTSGAKLKKVDEIIEKFDWDPLGAIRDMAALRLQTEDPAKLEGVLDEVYDDLAGHRLKIEADDGKKAKRESRRSRVELERYKQEQRADAERVKREAEADRARADAERETTAIQSWFSGMPKESYVWLRTDPDAPSIVRDVKREFQKHGQVISDEQAAAFADNQLKKLAQDQHNRFKHLLAPDQTTAAASATPAAGVPGAVTAQATTQPATPPPANSQRTRDLTNTATATTPTTPPPPPKKFDPNEDAEDARRRSLSSWAAKRKAQQQQP